MKVTGFVIGDEGEANLQRLTRQLGWSRSQLVRELLLRAVVQGEPSVSVVLPSALPTEAEEVHAN